MNLIDTRAIAAHVIRHLAHEQRRGRAVDIAELADEIGVRRADVREVVSKLHAEGHVDAKRMKLTMTGLGVAAALEGCKLREPRRGEPVEVAFNVA